MSSRSIRVLRSHVPNRKVRPLRVERLEERTLLSVITVTDPGDSGSGTLRSAINQANLDATPDTIDFNIGGGGHQVITLGSALPAITNTVTIDGASQPGYAGTPLVEINGGGLAIDLLDLQAKNCAVKSLVLNNITGYTNAINDIGGGAVIQGSYIGTDWTGTAASGSTVYCDIQAATAGLIGGTSPGQGNVLGNASYGILVPRSSAVLIEGNFVGTNALGTSAIPNAEGIAIQNDSGAGGLVIGGTAPGAGNLISGNTDRGINCEFLTGVTVQGNKIGTDITGTSAIANYVGVDWLSGDLIGGTAPGAGNLISGNGYGVEANDYNGPSTIQGNFIGTDITGTSALGNNVGVNGDSITIGGASAAARNIIAGSKTADVYASNSLVQGNYIGTDVTGEVALTAQSEAPIFNSSNLTVIGNVIASHSGAAVYMVNGCVFQGNLFNINKEGTRLLSTWAYAMEPLGGNNTIGGAAPGQGNLICGAIYLHTSASSGNVIQGNKLGTDITGTNVLAVGGIIMVDGASGNLVGGTTPGAGNLLLLVQDFNTGQSAGNDGVSDAILGNSFYRAFGVVKPIILAQNYTNIDVGAVNDPGDADTGPNGAQNYPVLTTAGSGSSTTVTGTLNSTPNDTFRIEFYASPAGDSPGQGTGARYLGYTTVTTNSNGNALINVGGLGASALGEEITATATVLTGSNRNSTSEFSAWISAANLAIQPTFSNLASPSITYGTPTVTLGGTIAAGTQIPAGTVAITVGGVTQNATIQPNGSFSTVFNTAALGVAGSPYPITYAFAAAGKFLAASDSSRTLTVTAAATSLALTTSANPSVPGQYLTFNAAVSAASGVPTPSGTIVFADGSGSLGSIPLQNGLASITLPLATLGTHAITATYVPANANFAPPAQPTTLAQVVQPVALEAGTQSGQSVLYVGGTAYNDVIDIEVEPKSSSQDQYEVTILTLNGRALSEFDAAGTASGHIVKVVGLANGQNDLIAVDCGSGTASWLYGGPGNNLLSGGDGNNVLVGGAGANILFGGVGRSLLIAGTGPSALLAGSGDSILIGGTTSFDTPTPSHFAAFDQVMAEWTSSDSYATRVADLSGTGTGASFAARRNGNIFLTTSGTAATVFDNGESDLLVGGSGMDWFFADLSNGADRDTVMNQKRKEILTPL